MEVPSDDSTDRTIRQLSIKREFIAPTPESHAMTQQAAHILKSLHETTTIQPKQCSAYPDISNEHPTVSSDVLRECDLAANEAPCQHDHAMTMPCDDSTDLAIRQSSVKRRQNNRSNVESRPLTTIRLEVGFRIGRQPPPCMTATNQLSSDTCNKEDKH